MIELRYRLIFWNLHRSNVLDEEMKVNENSLTLEGQFSDLIYREVLTDADSHSSLYPQVA